jgi:hypothetical protein
MAVPKKRPSPSKKTSTQKPPSRDVRRGPVRNARKDTGGTGPRKPKKG